MFIHIFLIFKLKSSLSSKALFVRPETPDVHHDGSDGRRKTVAAVCKTSTSAKSQVHQ